MAICEENVSLRLFTESDIKDKIRWINDPENNKYLHYDIPLEYEKTLNWFRNKNNSIRCDFTIEYDGKPIGLIGLLNIDELNKKAEYYICIGEKEYKGKGIATKATILILRYGFATLNLNKIYLNVDSENIAACNLYKKCGFVCEGEFIEDLFHNNTFINRKRYAILAKNFKAL